MMKTSLKFSLCAAVALVLCSFHTSFAGTIIKLSLGSDSPPDVNYAAGLFNTVNDGNAAVTSPGDQDTAVEFLDFLGYLPNIPAGASVSVTNVAAVGPAIQVGNTILQDYSGGQLRLWGPGGGLLLGVNLGNSQLVGNASPLPATGAHFSTTFGSPIPGPGGGALAPQIDPSSVTLTIGLGDINGGAGLSLASLTPIGPGIFQGPLNNFTANATASLDATGVPEPATISLMVLGLAGGVLRRRRS